MDAHERHALPEGWEWKRLEDVATVGAGNSAPQGDEFFVDGEYPFVRTQDVGREKATICLINTTDRINELAVKEFNLKLWPAKTLLIPKSGESTFLNRRALLGVPSFVSSHLATVIACNNLAPEYLYFWSLTVDAKKLTHDINYPSLRLSELESAKIPLPPLPTQRRIVSILEKAEETTRLRAQADELTDRLLQSVFLEMFGDPVKNSMGWEIKKIGNVAEHVSSGSTPKGGQEVYQDNGILFIRSQNVHMNKLILEDIAFISEEIHNAMKRTWVKNGDVLINITGASIGRVTWFSGEDNSANVNQHVCIIRPEKNSIQTEFLSYQISMPHYQKNIIAKQSGATRQAFNYSQIKDFDIIVPPIPLQQKFARIVEKVESMRQNQKQSYQQIDSLFNTLMQKAFMGELVA
ncbi:MAG: restriction endonuclease subunit S [Candidatus Methanoperedens sp.]|nr:restriction endonuclease subunit S [Candidatus Methanoperedens sp.]MCZ7395757.1 restriction endonuclease subunit S [Candidatus Methanoperedens sp.]